MSVYRDEYPYVKNSYCSGTDKQKWEYDENEHTLKSMGKCLTIYTNRGQGSMGRELVRWVIRCPTFE